MEFLPVTDHNILSEFYSENGLEVSDDIKADDGALYSIALTQNGKTLAAATLSYRNDCYILDYIAVDSLARRKGLGKKALTQIVQKASCFGATAIYLSARTPLFFRNFGFKEGSPKDFDLNADCIGCPKLNTECNPISMVLNLKLKEFL